MRRKGCKHAEGSSDRLMHAGQHSCCSTTPQTPPASAEGDAKNGLSFFIFHCGHLLHTQLGLVNHR